MGRRDTDPRPPIEIVGAAPSMESVQRISTGPRGPRRPGGRALVVAAGVVVLLVGGLVLGGGDGSSSGAGDESDEEARDNSAKLPLKRTTTTRPRSTTTRPPSTTTTIPVGPVFGAPVGAGLLVWGGSTWEVVDLDTGARAEVDLPPDDPYSAVAVEGGVVLLGGLREASYHPITPAGGTPRSVSLGAADQVLPAGRPDRVWLVDYGGGFEGVRTDEDAQVRLVDLGGDELQSFSVPARYVSGAVPGGVILERGGRVYVVGEQGGRQLAIGSFLGVTGDDVLLFTCDSLVSCAVVRQPADGGAATTVQTGEQLEPEVYQVVSGPDGSVALLTYAEVTSGLTVRLFDAEGREMGVVDGEALSLSGVGVPTWLPDGLGLVEPDGYRVRWIRPRGGEWVTETLPALDALTAEVALVIEW